MRRAIRVLAVSFAALAATAVASSVLVVPAQAAEPTAGQCYDYPTSALAKVSNTAAPVACEGPHRAETFFTGALSANFPDPAKATARQLADARVNNCSRDRMNSYLTLTTALPSRFRPVAIFPSTEQYAAGERWIRCDVVFSTGLGIGVMTKPAPVWVAENAANAATFNFCSPGVGYSNMPSPTKTQAQPCTNPSKQWILVANPAVAKIWQKYPGARTLNARASAKCKVYKNTYNGGIKDSFARGWSYIYPMAKGWSAGVRTASCWVPLKQYNNTKAR
jgi:hypothetical protein